MEFVIVAMRHLLPVRLLKLGACAMWKDGNLLKCFIYNFGDRVEFFEIHYEENLKSIEHDQPGFIEGLREQVHSQIPGNNSPKAEKKEINSQDVDKLLGETNTLMEIVGNFIAMSQGEFMSMIEGRSDGRSIETIFQHPSGSTPSQRAFCATLIISIHSGVVVSRYNRGIFLMAQRVFSLTSTKSTSNHQLLAKIALGFHTLLHNADADDQDPLNPEKYAMFLIYNCFVDPVVDGILYKSYMEDKSGIKNSEVFELLAHYASRCKKHDDRTRFETMYKEWVTIMSKGKVIVDKFLIFKQHLSAFAALSQTSPAIDGEGQHDNLVVQRDDHAVLQVRLIPRSHKFWRLVLMHLTMQRNNLVRVAHLAVFLSSIPEQSRSIFRFSLDALTDPSLSAQISNFLDAFMEEKGLKMGSEPYKHGKDVMMGISQGIFGNADLTNTSSMTFVEIGRVLCSMLAEDRDPLSKRDNVIKILSIALEQDERKIVSAIIHTYVRIRHDKISEAFINIFVKSASTRMGDATDSAKYSSRDSVIIMKLLDNIATIAEEAIERLRHSSKNYWDQMFEIWRAMSEKPNGNNEKKVFHTVAHWMAAEKQHKKYLPISPGCLLLSHTEPVQLTDCRIAFVKFLLEDMKTWAPDGSVLELFVMILTDLSEHFIPNHEISDNLKGIIDTFYNAMRDDTAAMIQMLEKLRIASMSVNEAAKRLQSFFVVKLSPSNEELANQMGQILSVIISRQSTIGSDSWKDSIAYILCDAALNSQTTLLNAYGIEVVLMRILESSLAGNQSSMLVALANGKHKYQSKPSFFDNFPFDIILITDIKTRILRILDHIFRQGMLRNIIPGGPDHEIELSKDHGLIVERLWSMLSPDARNPPNDRILCVVMLAKQISNSHPPIELSTNSARARDLIGTFLNERYKTNPATAFYMNRLFPSESGMSKLKRILTVARRASQG